MRLLGLHRRARVTLLTCCSVIPILLAAGSAQAAVEPTKFLFSDSFGAGVDQTTGGDICSVASKDTCRAGSESEAPSGFIFPETVAVAPDGNVYVGDNVNHRIQEFSPSGAFVLMFGWNVNKTKVKAGAPQLERNVCTESEVEKATECGAGEAGDGSAAQMLGLTQDVAVDSAGYVYVFDREYRRVVKFTAGGEFVWMIGGEVNQTEDGSMGASETEKNLCTAASGDVCKAGVRSPPESTARGAFKPEDFAGNLLVVRERENEHSEVEDVLYVGDEGRVQEFNASSGAWVDEIGPLGGTGRASALAVDSSGNVFVAESESPGVHEYNAKKQMLPLVIDPGSSKINAIAVDAYNRLAVVEYKPALGLLYSVAGNPIGEFASPDGQLKSEPKGLSFDVWEPANPLSDRMYVSEEATQEVEAYAPVLFPEAHTCAAEEVASTSARLCGEINPNGLKSTGLFEYGPVGEAVQRTPIAFNGEGTAFEHFGSEVRGLEPNQGYRFVTIAEAEIEGKVAQQAAAPLEFHTTTPPPEVPGAPMSSFVKARTVIFDATLNPEHAATTYYFEYGPCATLSGCADVSKTEAEASAQYGLVGVDQEASGLLPATTYSYRLVADNEHIEAGKTQGGRTVGVEAQFETAPPPAVRAITGPSTSVGIAGATIYGVVEPDGQPTVYRFELGVYEGAATRYDIASSGSAGSGMAPVTEGATLSGLQAGVVYAYRIVAESGDGGRSEGAQATFTTQALPLTIVEPPLVSMLATPTTGFPKVGIVKVKKKQKAKKKTKAKKAVARKRVKPFR